VPPNLFVAEEFLALEWVNVTSSNLLRVAYTPDAMRLWVEFIRKPGSNSKYHVYYYDNVPDAVWDHLLIAPSKGTFFDAHVKKALYPYQPYQ